MAEWVRKNGKRVEKMVYKSTKCLFALYFYQNLLAKMRNIAIVLIRLRISIEFVIK